MAQKTLSRNQNLQVCFAVARRHDRFNDGIHMRSPWRNLFKRDKEIKIAIKIND